MNKGRLVIIAGNKRAGKTTIFNRLAKDGFISLKFDYLCDALDVCLDKITKEKNLNFLII